MYQIFDHFVKWENIFQQLNNKNSYKNREDTYQQMAN